MAATTCIAQPPSAWICGTGRRQAQATPSVLSPRPCLLGRLRFVPPPSLLPGLCSPPLATVAASTSVRCEEVKAPGEPPPPPAAAAAASAAAAGGLKIEDVLGSGSEADPFEGDYDLREGPARYIPYVARVKLLLLKTKMVALKGVRYVAYASDVGESLRPVIRPWQVNLTYGIAAAYIAGDVGLTGYRASKAGCSREEVVAGCTHTAIFQGLASLALPALIIHTVVHQVQHAIERPSLAARLSPSALRYGPSVVGLGLIPFLPLLDPPCEWAVDAAFDKVLPAWRTAKPHEHGH
mmetsp:Transcript_59680/g.155220  ORF Transcript_59680/g.155220 Transcript_59680/m.155220 type:complete len:295 (-) Transcript_59680:17-901(-)